MPAHRLAYRPEEAADEVGVSRARMYELIAAGEIASVKIGRSRRIPRASLEGYLERLLAEQAGARLGRQPRSAATHRGADSEGAPLLGVDMTGADVPLADLPVEPGSITP